MRFKRILLKPREQADRDSKSPWHRCELAFIVVSHICSFTLSEDPSNGTYDWGNLKVTAYRLPVKHLFDRLFWWSCQ